jgi:hypothetical protein
MEVLTRSIQWIALSAVSSRRTYSVKYPHRPKQRTAAHQGEKSFRVQALNLSGVAHRFGSDIGLSMTIMLIVPLRVRQSRHRSPLRSNADDRRALHLTSLASGTFLAAQGGLDVRGDTGCLYL